VYGELFLPDLFTANPAGRKYTLSQALDPSQASRTPSAADVDSSTAAARGPGGPPRRGDESSALVHIIQSSGGCNLHDFRSYFGV
jgi:hypothetical protein